GAGQEVCAPGGVAGDRRIGQEREVVFAAGRIQAATAPARVLRERFPRVTGVLDDVDDRRMIEVRRVPVAGDAEVAPSDQTDVVRLRRVRDALPMLGEPVLVRELRHVRGGSVDVGEIVVLEEDNDELVEVVGSFRVNRSRNRRISGGDEGNHAPRDYREGRDEDRGRDHEERVRAACGGNQGHQREMSPPEPTLYADSGTAIDFGCCKAKYARPWNE